jgi:hypothetical protein
VCGQEGEEPFWRGKPLRIEELEPAFRAAFAKTDGPTLVGCVVDPNEANLPPKIPTEHAINFMKAMAKGQRRFHAALLEWWCRLACADVPLPTSVRATAYF